MAFIMFHDDEFSLGPTSHFEDLIISSSRLSQLPSEICPRGHFVKVCHNFLDDHKINLSQLPFLRF